MIVSVFTFTLKYEIHLHTLPTSSNFCYYIFTSINRSLKITYSALHISVGLMWSFSALVIIFGYCTNYIIIIIQELVIDAIDVINVYNVYKKFFVNAFIILSTFMSIKIT